MRERVPAVNNRRRLNCTGNTANCMFYTALLNIRWSVLRRKIIAASDIGIETIPRNGMQLREMALILHIAARARVEYWPASINYYIS